MSSKSTNPDSQEENEKAPSPTKQTISGSPPPGPPSPERTIPFTDGPKHPLATGPKSPSRPPPIPRMMNKVGGDPQQPQGGRGRSSQSRTSPSNSFDSSVDGKNSWLANLNASGEGMFREQPASPKSSPPTSNSSSPSRPLPITNSAKQSSLVQLKDSALEREAEDAVLRAIEDRNPIRPGKKETGANILVGLDLDELNHNFEGRQELSDTTDDDSKVKNVANAQNGHPTLSKNGQPSRGNVLNAGHKRNLTVEQALFGLTLALDEVSKNPTSQQQELTNEETDATPVGRFATNVNLVMNGLRKRKETEASVEASTKEDLADDENVEDYKKSERLEHHDPVAMEEGMSDSNINLDSSGPGQRNKTNPFLRFPYSKHIKNEWDQFNTFLTPRKATMSTYAKYIIIYLWTPAVAVAALLFHVFENPPTGRGSFNNDTASSEGPVERLIEKPSVSWWIIFICLRQVGILIMAKSLQALLVDFLALQTKGILRTFGPVVTLLFVQSKGWPFLTSFWGILNLMLVTGNSRFSHHWLFWQNLWGLFNEDNPAGDVTNTLWLRRICVVAAALGWVVAAKRVAIGIYLGRQTFSHFSDQLAEVMNRMLQVSQVAKLARDIENGNRLGSANSSKNASKNEVDKSASGDNLRLWLESALAEEESVGSLKGLDVKEIDESGRVIDTDDVDPYSGSLNDLQKSRIADILGRWEEPGRKYSSVENITIGSVLQFRRALAHMDTEYPFSAAFGVADSRENCVASSQAVYDRLMLKNEGVNGILHFNTLAALAIRKKGDLDPDQAKDLIRTFRPERDGTISMFDFVRSIDSVYKDLRMLRATIASSSKIDGALESIFNFVFYAVVSIIILAIFDIDPLALFLSLSSIILAFAFMIGSASAKYFEGLLFILFQRPYGIGDRINISGTESAADNGGAQGWIVEDVTLFTTTIYLAATNERATISNGSLAKSRIINGARSPKAIICLNFKFGVNVPYKRIEVFRSGVEDFVKARPREWLSLIAIRANRVEADQGYIEYVVALQHREAWQDVGIILDSKHALQCFMLELTKKLDLGYQSPPLPIMLNKGPQDHPYSASTDEIPKTDIMKISRQDTDEEDLRFRSYSQDVRAVAALFDAD